jgi:FKBP-type peptidyl-prolyl cis-trans isomerase SlyD
LPPLALAPRSARPAVPTLALPLLLVLLAARAAPAAGPADPVIEDGRKISLEYTLALENGKPIDSNVGKAPLVYQQGKQQLLPALEQALAGLHVDEGKRVTLTPAQGYGAVDPSLRREVEAKVVPEQARQAGALLLARDEAGNQRPVRVHEVRGETIVLDFNHPLAGQTLTFDLKVVKIE